MNEIYRLGPPPPDMVTDYLPEGHVPNSRPLADLYAQAMEELALPTPSVKLGAPFAKLDMMTNGFRPREFSILCGATGVGKTCLLANFSAAFTKANVPHFVASVETGPTDFIRRMISVYEAKDYNHGDPVPISELKKIHERHGCQLQSQGLQLSLYDNRFSVDTLMADIKWNVAQRGVKLAMIDNLNFFMEVTSASNQVVEMDRVIHDLIIFVKRTDVHLIMVMHPKKTDTGRVESEFDIKGSSTAVQESHNIFLFNKPHTDLIRAGTAVPGDREIKIQKMRRIGKYVGRRLLLSCQDNTTYAEKCVV